MNCSCVRKVDAVTMRSVPSRRLSRRDRSQERKKRQSRAYLKRFAYRSARGLQWSVLFFGLLVSLVAALVLLLAGLVFYAIPFLLLGGIVGAALLKLGSL